MKRLCNILILLLMAPIALEAGWNIITNMPIPRHGLAAVELNGKIYLIGGQAMHHGGGVGAVNTVTVYDPATGEWDAEVASLNYARSYAYAATHNGYIYVLGGRNGILPVPQVERYNPEANRWTVATELPFPRDGLGGAVWGDSLFVIGGSSPDSLQGMNRVDIYRFSDSTWTTGPAIHQARAAGLTLRLRNRLYVLGGIRLSPLASMEIFENGTWNSGPNLPQSMANFGGVVYGDSLVIAGGIFQHGSSNSCYIYSDNEWIQGPLLNYPRAGLVMVRHGDSVFAFGGRYHQSAVSQVEELSLSPVAIEPETNGIPQEFSLGNYPNPFNPRTTIQAKIPEISHIAEVHLRIYNLLGQLVYESKQVYIGAGEYQWRFNANSLQKPLSGGVYVYRVTAGRQQESGKMVYLP